MFTMLAGVAAGCLGALLGLGGAIFLIPVLDKLLDVPFPIAKTFSLVTVIATSSFVSLAPAGRQLVNIRLAMVLQMFTVVGAELASHLRLADSTSRLIFGLTAAAGAVAMLLRRHRRNVIHDATIDTGLLGGRLHDADTDEHVSYRVRRLPLALVVSIGAGVLSTLVGVGGGIIIVPALNIWCGVPLRVAAATSALMIGVTAVPGVLAGYAAGYLARPALAAAAVLGVLAGSRAGFVISARSRAKELKVFLAGVLLVVAAIYLFKGGR
jgi:hypothetical protein